MNLGKPWLAKNLLRDGIEHTLILYLKNDPLLQVPVPPDRLVCFRDQIKIVDILFLILFCFFSSGFLLSPDREFKQ